MSNNLTSVSKLFTCLTTYMLQLSERENPVKQNQPENTPKNLSRRKVLAGVAASTGIGLSGLTIAPAHASKDTIVDFMNRSANILLKAALNSSPKAFLNFIMRYTDVGGIAIYSLGSYRAGLEKKYEKTYIRGMARHITRYFTYQSRQYRIIKVDVGKKSWQVEDAYYIETKLTLVNGSTYNVLWQIVRRDGRYKIANVRVLGFWLAKFQRTQFETYISKQGGSVNALVAILKSRK